MGLYNELVTENFQEAIESCIERLLSVDRPLAGRELRNVEQLLKGLSTSCGSPKEVSSIEKNYVPPKGPLLCPFCSDLSGNYESLRDHLGRRMCGHNFKKPVNAEFRITWSGVTCKKCLLNFPDYSNFATHRKDTHKWLISNMYCSICNIFFPYGYIFYKHHTSTMLHMTLKSKLFKKLRNNFAAIIHYFHVRCAQCKLNVKPEDYPKHLQDSHSAAMTNLTVWCQGCDCMFTADKYQDHVNSTKHTTTPWYPIMCVLCGEELVGQSNYANHLQTNCPKLSDCSKFEFGETADPSGSDTENSGSECSWAAVSSDDVEEKQITSEKSSSNSNSLPATFISNPLEGPPEKSTPIPMKLSFRKVPNHRAPSSSSLHKVSRHPQEHFTGKANTLNNKAHVSPFGPFEFQKHSKSHVVPAPSPSATRESGVLQKAQFKKSSVFNEVPGPSWRSDTRESKGFKFKKASTFNDVPVPRSLPTRTPERFQKSQFIKVKVPDPSSWRSSAHKPDTFPLMGAARKIGELLNVSKTVSQRPLHQTVYAYESSSSDE